MGLGIFNVQNEDITIEYWIHASASPVPTNIWKGKILNLITTFRICTGQLFLSINSITQYKFVMSLSK
jgi:hypothetical protein